MTIAPLAYDPNGGIVVCADGPELVAFSATNDVPLWKQFCDGVLVDLAVAGSEVVALDTDGRMWWWRKIDGALARDALLDRPARGLAVRPGGGFGVLVQGGVALLSRMGDAHFLDLDFEPTAIAFSPSAMALGGADGRVDIVAMAGDSVNGLIASLNVGAPVSSLAWSPLGYFLAATSQAILVLRSKAGVAPPPKPGQPPQPAPTVWYADQRLACAVPPDKLTCSVDGVLLAATTGTQVVSLWELTGFGPVGQVSASREVTDVRFGPGTWIALGYDHCDMNRCDVLTGFLTKSQPGLGRVSVGWGCEAQINHAAIRGALASARAGTAPIARKIEIEGLLGAALNDSTGKRRSPLMLAFMGCGGLGFLCGGLACCSSLLTYFW